MIPSQVKRECLAARAHGMSSREIYEQIFVPGMDGEPVCTPAAFARSLRKWRKKCASQETLEAGTYPGFTAHGATVQVDAEGNVRQAWIKQHSDINWSEIVEYLTSAVTPQEVTPCQASGESMLEIPLFDLHFGTATYPRQLAEILGIIRRGFDEINIIFGQDVLHANDLRGHTAKGTDLGEVDFPSAWRDAWEFWAVILKSSIEHARRVRVWYSRGNHDECSAWCLFKALAVAFPGAVWDDTIKARKCLTWNGVFVGFGHCEYTGRTDRIFQNFVLEFPNEFAAASVREIHAGHLHRESIDNGIMVRRLATAAPPTEWEQNQGLIGAHRRFQLFEWLPGRLKAIYYI